MPPNPTGLWWQYPGEILMDGLQIWIFNLMRGKKRGEGRSKATWKAQMVESILENSDRPSPQIDRQNAILKIRK